MDTHYQELILGKILDTITSGIIFVDTKGKILMFNRAAGNILSIDSKDMMNEHYTQLLSRIESEELKSFISNIRGLEITFIEKDIKTLINNTRKILRVYLASLKDDQTSLGTLVVFDDYTEFYETQKIIMWHDMIKQIVHMLENPITIIGLSVERMKKQYRKNANFIPIFETSTRTILNEVEHLRKLIKELVHFLSNSKE